MRALLLTSLVAAGCGSDTLYMIVTVDGRPAVHDVHTLAVSVANDGSTLDKSFDVGTHAFPVTFSLSTPGRTGDLQIQIQATDANGFLVGLGQTTTSVTASSADVLLDSADFVVNTDFASDQFLTDDYEAIGFQLAATADGTWLAGYRDNCTVPCNMFGRRFDVDGRPVSSEIAAGTNGFPLTTILTDFSSEPAVAASGTTSLAFWDYDDAADSVQGVACRALDANGAAASDQVDVELDPDSDVVSATALPDGNFAVVWKGFLDPNYAIRAAIVQPDCTSLGTTTISTDTAFDLHRSAVAASGSQVMYAWILSGDAHVRLASDTNGALTADQTLIPQTASEQVEFVRVAALGTGFAVAVRWGSLTGDTGGRIDLYRTTDQGALIGGPTVITDKNGSDPSDTDSFGIATRTDGAVMVVWHACAELGDGSGCGVFGRIVRPTGVPVGDAFNLATTTSQDQINPSVVGLGTTAFVAGWTDKSGTDPDHSGSAARARILYPAFDDASAVLGAACGSGTLAPCGTGLTCAAASDGVSRCFAICAAAPPQCPGGGTCTTNACVF